MLLSSIGALARYWFDLRFLQGLALGEIGGRSYYVAEQAPENRRDLTTDQTTATLGLYITWRILQSGDWLGKEFPMNGWRSSPFITYTVIVSILSV